MALTKIKTSGIADNAITNAKMADDAIDSADFADGSIDNVHVATGLDAVKLADGTVTNTEFQYINTLSSNAQTQISAALPKAGGTMTGDLIISENDPNIRMVDTNTSSYSQLTNTNGSLKIEADLGAGSGSSTLEFTVDNSTKMLIDSSGKVGIGTSSPANILDISQSGNEVEIRLASNSNNTRGFIYANNNNQIGFKDSDGDSVYQTGDNESHIWSTQGSETMRLTAGGNFGIGASPSYRFDTQDNSTTWAGRVLNTNAGGQGLLVRTDASNGAMAFGVYANGAYRVQIAEGDSTFGNVVLGVNGSVTAPSFSWDSDKNTGMYRTQADHIGFTTAGVKRTEIASDGGLYHYGLASFSGAVTHTGNTALGGTYTGYACNIYGSNEVLAARSSNATMGAMSLRVDATASTGGTQILYIATRASMAGNASLANGTEPIVTAQGGRTLHLGVDSTSILALDSSSNASFAGNVTVNSDTMLVDSTGHGFCIVDSGSTSAATWIGHKMGGTTKYLVGMEGGASAQYRIYDSGDASVAVHITTTGNSWVADSDERMKKDITSMENRLDDLLKIKVRRFKWKHNDKVDFGFVAQELETCAPDAVEVGSDEVYSKEESKDSLTAVEGALKNPYGVSREQLIPMMVKSIQELSAKVTALENA